MKIALYQPWIYLHGGLEKSLLEVVTRSQHDWVVFTGHYEPENTFPEFKNVDVRVLNSTSVKRTLFGTLISAFHIARQKIPAEDFDAVVVWCDGLGDFISFRNHSLPLMNICSTPLRAAFDPVYERQVLANSGFLYHLSYKLFKFGFKIVDKAAWRYFDSIITTSTEVKNRIIEGELCTDESRMVMAYPGIEFKSSLKDVTYEPFILLPGRIMWTKNIQLAISAFLKADLNTPWKLKIAGFLDEKSQTYLEELKELANRSSNIEFIISPSHQELSLLYKQTAFCLFPPLNEDWGIVPLESMNHAKAVIANASGGPKESIENKKTGFLLQPEVDAWAKKIRLLAGDIPLCKSMGINANERVKSFSWSEFVKRIDNTLSNIIKE